MPNLDANVMVAFETITKYKPTLFSVELFIFPLLLVLLLLVCSFHFCIHIDLFTWIWQSSINYWFIWIKFLRSEMGLNLNWICRLIIDSNHPFWVECALIRAVYFCIFQCPRNPAPFYTQANLFLKYYVRQFPFNEDLFISLPFSSWN